MHTHVQYIVSPCFFSIIVSSLAYNIVVPCEIAEYLTILHTMTPANSIASTEPLCKHLYTSAGYK